MKRFYLLTILTLVIFVITINADILVYERGSSSVSPFIINYLRHTRIGRGCTSYSILNLFLQPMEEFHDLPARFGASFPANGMRVLAVKSFPDDGCNYIDPPPKNISEYANARWAVLIARLVLQKYNCGAVCGVHAIESFMFSFFSNHSTDMNVRLSRKYEMHRKLDMRQLLFII